MSASPPQALPDTAPLPALREELRLHPGPSQLDGSPSWLVYDPVRHRYCRLDREAMKLLSYWPGATAGELRLRWREDQGSPLEAGAIEELLAFLEANGLVVLPPGRATEKLAREADAQGGSAWQWLLHHYLFIRLPLVRPEAFLHRLLAWTGFVFTPFFLGMMAAVAVLGLYLVSRQWDAFIGTFPHFFSAQGLAVYGLSLVFCKAVHELGHGLVATRYGCRVPTMGVALVVLLPMLYTDVTDAWRLRSRVQRIWIDCAGVIAELCLAACATLLWVFLPEGPWRSAAFVIATTSWVMTLAVNLSPFMRFDGYYLLSDLIGMPNLHARADAFGRWRLREALFDLGVEPPEPVSRRRRRFLIAFAWTTWLYRLTLFIAIALAVYHLFFKLLGLLLFAVELIWFIGQPVARELAIWWRMRERIRARPRWRWSLLFAAAVVFAMAVPINGRVQAPVVLGLVAEEVVYAPEPGRVRTLHVREGERVTAGQPLATLVSDELAREERDATIRLGLVRARIARGAADAEDLAQLQELQSAEQAELAALAAVGRRQDQLVVRAPIDGRVIDLDETLMPGRWVGTELRLARIIDPARGEDLRGYVSGDDAWRVRAGTRGRFIFDDPSEPVRLVEVVEVASTAAEWIDSPYLMSNHAGPIAVSADARGRPVPLAAQHALWLRPVGPAGDRVGVFRQVDRGVAILDGEAESLLVGAARRVLAVLVRESGL